MFEEFIKHNQVQRKITPANGGMSDTMNHELQALFRECGGISINNGVYRVYTAERSQVWAINLNAYFPNYKKNLIPFGYDWLGRQYCLHTNRKNIIIMIDPSAFRAYELEHSLVLFHNVDLITDRDDSVSEEAFKEILLFKGIGEISYNKCIGYKVSPLLGGSDSQENMEICDMEVYWEFQFQIYTKIKDLPDGTSINSTIFEK